MMTHAGVVALEACSRLKIPSQRSYLSKGWLLPVRTSEDKMKNRSAAQF